MKKSADTPTRWFAAWRVRPTPSVRTIDPADLGTAFGLDLSIPGEHDEGPPARQPASAGWMARWTARRAAS